MKNAIALFIMVLSSSCMLAEEPAKPSSEILTEDLFEGLPTAKPESKNAAQIEDKSTAKTEQAEIIAGEDLDFGSAQDPFAEVARKMQKSQTLLEKRELTTASNALRGEIVSDLDKLLNKMQKQCAGGSCNKPSSNCKDGNCPKPGNASKPGQASNKPASDSTARLDKPGSNQSQTNDDAAIIREVWGHLPPKLREAMQNASLEEYLPKYEQHIRDYYRRLAEETRSGVK